MNKFLTIILLFIIVITTTGAGYVGTLPNIDAEFSYLRKQHDEKAMAPFSVEELDKQNEAKLKPIPRDNDNYVDIIVKKDKTTQYLKDVSSVIIILEKLRKCLNTNQDYEVPNPYLLKQRFYFSKPKACLYWRQREFYLFLLYLMLLK